MASKRKASDSIDQKDKESKESYFTWTDEEQSLLLNIVIDYKSKKASVGEDWESLKTRYDDLTKMYIDSYPSNPENTQEFPNNKDKVEVFSKSRITTKLKRIKLGYKKAVDSGRRSGGGRVVAMFFDECAEIWSGSPSVDAMDNGIESSVEIDHDKDNEEESEKVESQSSSVDESDSRSDTNDIVVKTSDARRNMISKLKEKKNAKLTKKISVENRMLLLGQEELELKKKMMEKLETSENKYMENMQSFATSLTSLTSTLQNGFNMLGMMMQQNQQYNPLHHYQQNQQYNSHVQGYQQNPSNLHSYWNSDSSQFDQNWTLVCLDDLKKVSFYDNHV